VQAPKCAIDKGAVLRMMETAATVVNVTAGAHASAQAKAQGASWQDFIPASCPNVMAAPGFNLTQVCGPASLLDFTCPNVIHAPGYNQDRMCEFSSAHLSTVLAQKAVQAVEQALQHSNLCPNMISARTLTEAQGILLNATLQDSTVQEQVLNVTTDMVNRTKFAALAAAHMTEADFLNLKLWISAATGFALRLVDSIGEIYVLAFWVGWLVTSLVSVGVLLWALRSFTRVSMNIRTGRIHDVDLSYDEKVFASHPHPSPNPLLTLLLFGR
jgi:PIN domain nuclease of toxin-antitoxin system